ncbi:hypothetical protein RF11_15460 [Thelohanellus kitauei]|uniref:Uncharacterized protein n=1 Tax=Thelohanellus kitauei TaxID=669202 RepID=A0A0C2MK59_THEKT|nr:hypothetical protein RF11_15460 [Thelohanellus kitauei]
MVLRVDKCNISVYKPNLRTKTIQFSTGYEFLLMKEVKYEFEKCLFNFKNSKTKQGSLMVRFNTLYIEFERHENTCTLQQISITPDMEETKLIDPCGGVANYTSLIARTEANRILMKIIGATVALFTILML